MNAIQMITAAVAVLYIVMGYLLARPHLKRTRCMHCGSILTATKSIEMDNEYNERRGGYHGRRTYFCIREWKWQTVGIFRYGPKMQTVRKFPRAA